MLTTAIFFYWLSKTFSESTLAGSALMAVAAVCVGVVVNR